MTNSRQNTHMTNKDNIFLKRYLGGCNAFVVMLKKIICKEFYTLAYGV